MTAALLLVGCLERPSSPHFCTASDIPNKPFRIKSITDHSSLEECWRTRRTAVCQPALLSTVAFTLPGVEMSANNNVLAVGTRVKMSPLGTTRCPRLVKKIGTVVRTRSGNYSSTEVHFDGNKTRTPLHKDYVERLLEAE